MQLIIDTSEEIVKIGLADSSGRSIEKDSWSSKYNESEVLLKRIDSLLDLANVKMPEVKKVVVCSGPGSYTALRVGISSANAIAYSLNLPVVGYKKSYKNLELSEVLQAKTVDKFNKVALPLYKRDPHITTKKPRL